MDYSNEKPLLLGKKEKKIKLFFSKMILWMLRKHRNIPEESLVLSKHLI